jgi:hypothetical protein
MYPRSKMVVDARAAGLHWLVDGVFMNLKDTGALRTECAIARELGFVGKMAIHPTQVDVMHEVFSPTAEEVDYAQGLLAAYREGEARGIGAVKFRGMMVDLANVKLAERTISLAGGGMSTATTPQLHRRARHRPARQRAAAHYPPLRTLADVHALEQVPLEQRITRWDFAQNLLDGCRHAPRSRGAARHRQRRPRRPHPHLDLRRAGAALAAHRQPAARQRRRPGRRVRHRQSHGAGAVRHHRSAACWPRARSRSTGCWTPARWPA